MLFTPRRRLFILLIIMVMFLGFAALTPVHAEGEPPPGEGAVVAGDVVSPSIPTAATFLAVFSGFLALFPGLNGWFKALPNATKRGIIILLSIAVAAVLVVGNTPPGAPIGWLEILFFAQNLIAALFASQVMNETVNKPLNK
jgi:hypothetical protein